MLKRQSAVLPFFLCPGILLLVSSCSSGPTPPKMGTPEWYWAEANNMFTSGDLAKAQDRLDGALQNEGPIKPKAAVFQLVFLSGVALGNKELGDAYDAGWEEVKETAKPAQTAELRRLENAANRASKASCMALAQALSNFLKDNANATEFSVEFAFPPETPGESPLLANARKGILPPEVEIRQMERATVKRGVVSQAASMVGAGSDLAKAAEMFKAQPVKVPRAVFLYGLAEGLFEESKIFDQKRMNEPETKRSLYQIALNCLKPASEAGDEGLKKKAKDLGDKIAKEQKSLPKVA